MQPLQLSSIITFSGFLACNLSTDDSFLKFENFLNPGEHLLQNLIKCYFQHLLLRIDHDLVSKSSDNVLELLCRFFQRSVGVWKLDWCSGIGKFGISRCCYTSPSARVSSSTLLNGLTWLIV